MVFGGLLRDHRLRLSWTQEELADRSGMSVHAVSVLESGKRKPRLSTLTQLADALELVGADREALIAATRSCKLPDPSGDHTETAVPQATLPSNRPANEPSSGLRRSHPPARVGHFCGRDGELAEIRRRLLDDTPPRPVVVVSGPGGIGKTATAVELAHTVADWFPDGCLFVDLGGHDAAGALSVDDALVRLLGGLGVTGQSIPPDRDERASMFRSAARGRAMLLVLDNAAGTDQVLPLLPDDDGCPVLITSRRDLAALGTYRPAVSWTLGALTAQDSMNLLGRVIGDRRVVENVAAAGEIADLCDGYPLALRISAARLTADSGLTTDALATEMRKERHRLAALVVEDGARSIRGAFAPAYQGLDQTVRQTFRLLGGYPAATFTLSALAAMGGVPLERTAADLAALSAHSLVQPAGDQRYGLHDLIRLFAQERTEAEDSDADTAEAFVRLADWLLQAAAAVNEAVSPGNRVPGLEVPDAAIALPFARDRSSALQFLQDEIDNLATLLEGLTARGHHAATAHTAYLLAGALDRLRPAQALAITGAGVSAAEALGDPATRRALHAAYCAHSLNLRRPDEALEHALVAVGLVGAIESASAKANTYVMLGRTYGQLRQYQNAVDAYEQAIGHYRRVGNGPGLAIALNNISGGHKNTGRLDLALTALTEAVRISAASGDARSGAYANSSLGSLYTRLGDNDRALEFLSAGLDLAREIGDGFHEVWTLAAIADALVARGVFDEALEHLDGALEIGRQMGHRHGEALIQQRLGTVQSMLGNQSAAGEHLLRALDLWDDAYEVHEQARLHHALAVFAEREGQNVSAEFHRRFAARLFRQVSATSEADRAESGQPRAF